MAWRNGKRPIPPEATEVRPASPFRWPSRSRADEAERAAGRAAKAGLERLRARTPRPAPLPALSPPHLLPLPAPRTIPDEVPVEEMEFEEPEHAVEPRNADSAPAPPLWDEELEELTEQLVAELRRDLGPEAP